MTTAVLALLAAGPASAYNYVFSGNGESWGVQDGAAPRVDSGSIRDTPSNSLRGFGGIRVRVSTDPLRNGELMRGFNLRFDPPTRFVSSNSVDMGGVAVSRSMLFNRANNWGRWLDTFQNTTGAPITVDVSFGGQTGIGNASGSTNSRVTDTSSGDAQVTDADSWALTRTGTAPAAAASGPSAVVIGTPAPFGGALARVSNFLRDPFTDAPATSGHESNFVGYQNTFTLQPGEARALAHFVVIGTSESSSGTGATAPGAQVTAVRSMAMSLAGTPVFGDLSNDELCALENWDPAAVGGNSGFDAATDCPTAQRIPQPPVAAANPTTTGSPYDVVGKTIGELRADMEAGRATSQQITRAYLDRIAAYDVGPFGFNSYNFIARDAMAQAKAADDARAGGRTSPVLGIPLAIKDLYDTKDMPATNGSLVFEGFQPQTDATQVRLLREAGAVILGKASLEEYAQSGQYSDSAFGQVWNAFSPSKSSIASSGGTAVATAAHFAAAGLGSQTGDSLYGPASAASLFTLRGTDGIASQHGLFPLTYLQDFGGTIAKSAPDLADMLNVTTGTDPLDPVTVEADADAKRPADWRSTLDPDALEGKRIGYYADAFVDPFGTTETVNVQRDALRFFEEAGATLVELGGAPTIRSTNTGGDRGYTGWQMWINDHPNSPYTDAREILGSQKRLPYRRLANGYTGTGMQTPAQIQAYKDARAGAKDDVAAYLGNPPNPVVPGTSTPSPGAVDAVAFPGLKSVVSLNDGGSSAFGRGDPPTNGAGAPSIAFPAGVNTYGEPVNIQLAGRAFDDPDLVGYAYAFDQVADQQILPSTVPALPFRADPTPPVIDMPDPVAPVTGPGSPTGGGGAPTTGSGDGGAARQIRRSATFRTARSARVGRRGFVRVRVRCGAVVATRCRTTILVRFGKRTVARRTVVLRRGSRTVRVRIGARGRRILARRGSATATLVASVRDSRGKRVARRSIVLRLVG